MESVPLTHIWHYTEVDRAFWAEHLEGWLPQRLIDAHVHIADPSLRLEPMTDEKRRQHWAAEVSDPMTAQTLEHCDRATFPGRAVEHLAFGLPDLDFDIEASNDYARGQCVEHSWHSLSLLLPQWSGERVAEELDKPGVIGVKPYYSLIGRDPATRDRYIEASIFEFLPHCALEVLNERRAWVTLHVPKADRLGHPDNIREVKEIRRRYPGVTLVIAHFGRCYTEPHAREAFPALADDTELYFDNSAVLNPVVHRLALKTFGPERIVYGTDNPIFYMRGRRRWTGRRYINQTNANLHFNKDREPPEVEARYTLYMYEALRAIGSTCEDLGIGPDKVEAIFCGNAERLIRRVSARDE